jgi:hypothetical protein
MTTFDEREAGFEAKFVHDAELRFRVIGRRDRLLGEWAGALVGLQGQALADYVASVVHAEIDKTDDAVLTARIGDDLKKAGKEAEARAVPAKMAECLKVAMAEIKA